MRAVDNPFSVTRQHSLKYRFAVGDDWGPFMTRLEQNHWHGAIVGKKGNGKTTLLLELEAKLLNLGFGVKKLFLNREKRRFTRDEFAVFLNKLDNNDIILFDGSEQMSYWRWRLFRWRVRKAKGLIITAHKPSKLPTIMQTITSFQYFEEMVKELIQDHLPLQKLYCSEKLRQIHTRHKGNIRLALRELYDCSSQ